MSITIMHETNPGHIEHVYIRKQQREKIPTTATTSMILHDIFVIANSNASSEESFEVKFGKELILQLRKEYTFNSNVLYNSYSLGICENSSLLAKGLNS